MAMFLSGVSEIIIKRIGRWSSEAFLKYIRDQVDAFSAGVSQKMLENESFHHLNAKNSDIKENSEKSDGPVCHIPFNVHYSKTVLADDVEVLFSQLSC